MEVTSTPIVGILMLYGRWRGRPMAGVLPRGAMITRRRCGMRPMVATSTPIEDIPVLWVRWHGRPRASASPRGAMIRRCRCGLQGESLSSFHLPTFAACRANVVQCRSAGVGNNVVSIGGTNGISSRVQGPYGVDSGAIAVPERRACRRSLASVVYKYAPLAHAFRCVHCGIRPPAILWPPPSRLRTGLDLYYVQLHFSRRGKDLKYGRASIALRLQSLNTSFYGPHRLK